MQDDNGPQAYSVVDGDRELQFTGWLLGKSTSWRYPKARWAEIEIYKTIGGQYVVAGAGRSTIVGEQDKLWACSSEYPEGVIERLYLVDPRGVRYIPYVSKQAINQAREKDPEFANAYLIERVD